MFDVPIYIVEDKLEDSIFQISLNFNFMQLVHYRSDNSS